MALIPSRLAAVLSGRSYAAFVRDVRPCCLEPGGKVSLARLEQHLGVSFDPTAIYAADRRLDRTRERERHYKQRTTP